MDPGATLARALAVVVDITGIPLSDVTGRSKKYAPATARRVAWYVTRELTKASYKTIGRLAKRDHTSVLEGCKEVESRLVDGPVGDLVRATFEMLRLAGPATRVPTLALPETKTGPTVIFGKHPTMVTKEQRKTAKQESRDIMEIAQQFRDEEQQRQDEAAAWLKPADDDVRPVWRT